MGVKTGCHFREGWIVSVKLWNIKSSVRCDDTVLGCIGRCMGVYSRQARIKIEFLDVMCVVDETLATLEAIGSAGTFDRFERWKCLELGGSKGRRK